MTLGPGTLKQGPIRSILKVHKFQGPLQRFVRGEIEWSHKDLASLKALVRVELRKQQEGRCIYCRRPLKVERRNAHEDLEHFLDKSREEYRKWAFCCVNLSLACHPCNMEKGIRDLGKGLVPPAGTLYYECGPGRYDWIHPFFDDFHKHIEVGKGWTYKVTGTAPFATLAQKLIDDLKLIQVQQIEARAEEFKEEIRRLTALAMECIRRGRPKHASIVLAASTLLQDATTFG